jgi:uncharacterized oxidoreductase
VRLTGNTVLITGGGSGIGRGLAEALHKRGSQVIISGRRRGHLDKTVAANPGMHAIELDVTDPANIASVTRELIRDFPQLNVLINNAGIMLPDDAAGTVDDALLLATVATNLLGPMRMTSALIEHFKAQEYAAVINMASVLGFVPLAMTAVYSATKAAVHSYTLSLRYRLRSTSVMVQEIAPPWVRTDLMNSSNEPRAMPLDQFIAETMTALGTDAEEVLVEQARMMRSNPGPQEHAFVTQFNDMMAGLPPQTAT